MIFLYPLLVLVAAVLIVGALVYGLKNIDGIDESFRKTAIVILKVVLVIVVVVVLTNMATLALGGKPLVPLCR